MKVESIGTNTVEDVTRIPLRMRMKAPTFPCGRPVLSSPSLSAALLYSTQRCFIRCSCSHSASTRRSLRKSRQVIIRPCDLLLQPQTLTQTFTLDLIRACEWELAWPLPRQRVAVRARASGTPCFPSTQSASSSSSSTPSQRLSGSRRTRRRRKVADEDELAEVNRQSLHPQKTRMGRPQLVSRPRSCLACRSD